MKAKISMCPRALERRKARIGFSKAENPLFYRMGEGLVSRQDLMRLSLKQAALWESIPGGMLPILKKQFPKTKMHVLTHSPVLAERYKKQQPFLSRKKCQMIEENRLPFEDGSLDGFFLNGVLHEIENIPFFLSEIKRVLCVDGVFQFAMFGPDTFKEFREAWGSEASRSVINFIDMHDFADQIVHAGLSDPVVDVDMLTLTYKDFAGLYRDLTRFGFRNVLSNRVNLLRTKKVLHEMESRYPKGSEKIGASFELIYGHAWKSEAPMKKKFDHEVSVPLSKIERPVNPSKTA